MKQIKRSFWRQWGLNLLAVLDSSFTRLAVGASIVGFFGGSFAKLPYAWGFLVALGLLLLGLVLWTKPPFSPPPSLAGPLELQAVNEFLAETPRVGILGLQGVGKTTFLDATVSRPSQRKQTEKPYGQFVAIPDSSPERHLVLIDSVGGRAHVQFLVQGMAATVLFFVDHNEDHEVQEVDPARLEGHRELARQLVHVSTDQNILVDRIIVVANKSDIWQSNESSSHEMSALVLELCQTFMQAPNYRVINSVVPYSNESRHDVATLLSLSA
jgi:hypothetical protein